ncbi:methyltransferase domain-containing protein [Granulicella sp. 5B5]|nr:methyltransferase domain-containing protein [Granulicella sp. 5B5]
MMTETPAQILTESRDEALSIHLRCTRCHARMDGSHCRHCGFRMIVEDDIVRALPAERVAHYARFVADYERIRAAEGRGSQTEHYYLGLPYKDATGRNSDQWRIRARSFNCLFEQVLRPMKVRTVLDLGAGNCWMSYRLALAHYEPVAVDLLTNNHDGLGAAIHYRHQLSKAVPRFQAEAANLPFEDEQFDAVIFNASFHYAEDYETVLREALRCVKRGGIVIISDTPWYSHEESGMRMVAERQAMFLKHYGTASHALSSQEFLTDGRLALLAEQCGIRWEIFYPKFGVRWALRPWLAKVRRRREPSRFRIYVARKHA